MSEYAVTLSKYRATWSYYTKYPGGGGFGSSCVAPQYVALACATRNIPIGTTYSLSINGKRRGEFVKA